MKIPNIVTSVPGPKSLEIWEKERKHITTGLFPGTLLAPIAFEKGEGSLLWDVDGNVYIDCAAGVMTNSTGHCHPKLVENLRNQVENLWHVHDSPTPQRYKLCDSLARLAPGKIDTFEFYTGGSETIEAAMRAATSYNKGREEFLGFYPAFHGKTLGSRSVINGMREFGRVLSNFQVPYPYCYHCPFNLEYPSCNLLCAKRALEVIKKFGDRIAAMVFEPILGGSGMSMPPKEYWQTLFDACKEEGILTIADEIVTAVGRTGKFFAVEHFGIEPDLICFGKGLGSGFPVMSLGGKREIMTAEPYGAPYGASTSFGGGALSVAAAYGTVRTIEEENILENVNKTGKFIKDKLNQMKEAHPLIGDVRCYGLLCGIELVKDKKTKEPANDEGKEIFLECLRNGLNTIAYSHLMRLTPPLTISLDLARKALDIYEAALSKVEKKNGYA